jgi:transcriptional regulator GlxA family with amidase domain
MTESRFPALTPQSAVKIGILIFDEVEELDFVGPLEVFGMARQFGANCGTLVTAEEIKPIRCRHGLVVIAGRMFAECPMLDILIVPGGLGARTHARQNTNILNFVRGQRGLVASVCTGALILAAAGVLDGVTATTHHSSLDLLRQYKDVHVQQGVRFVIGQRVATSAGVSAGIDLALALIGRTWNETGAADHYESGVATIDRAAVHVALNGPIGGV